MHATSRSDSAVTITAARPAGCLAPVLVDHVVDDPDAIRTIARANGPFYMPARYLIDGDAAGTASAGVRKNRQDVPPELIGPVWRGDWAVNGEVHVDDAAPLLHHAPFIDAARSMCDAAVVVPQQVFVNLNTPARGAAFSHTDVPEFIGFDRTNSPGWFLIAMGASGLFEDLRITIITAVAWFHRGERGYFRYWPAGRDNDSVRHDDMWNTAVVGDNDFMHHKVERVGPDGAAAPDGMTIDTVLDHDGDAWVVVDDGTTLATFEDDEVRMSLSWKARVYADEATQDAADAGRGAIGLEEALDRFSAVIDEPLAGTGADALANANLRQQLSRFNGYVVG